MGWSALVGAYYSPHAASDPYHILQFIYILYTDLWGFMCFLRDFVGFILIASLQERGKWHLTGYHATAICTVLADCAFLENNIFYY